MGEQINRWSQRKKETGGSKDSRWSWDKKKFRLISILRLLWITVSLIESYPVPNIILVVIYTFTAVILFWVALCGYVIHRLCRIYTFLHTVAPHLDKTNMWSILRAITAQHTRAHTPNLRVRTYAALILYAIDMATTLGLTFAGRSRRRRPKRSTTVGHTPTGPGAGRCSQQCPLPPC